VKKHIGKKERLVQMKNPRLLQTTKTMLATVALTGLMAGSVARLHAAATSSGAPDQYGAAKGQVLADSDSDKNSCKGQNSCKGRGGCKTGDNGCMGKNSCKGKGGCKSSGTKNP
jgi:hypothetical protein